MFKTILFLLFLSIAVFVGATVLTMRVESASDGVDMFGYPLIFYTAIGGKCSNCSTTFELWKLIIDYCVAVISGIGIIGLYKWSFKK